MKMTAKSDADTGALDRSLLDNPTSLASDHQNAIVKLGEPIVDSSVPEGGLALTHPDLDLSIPV
jgi:hypothetical protein